jgi:hypothetical protein
VGKGKEAITWATISGIAGIVTARFALTQFVIAPLERRIDVARDNIRQAFYERDASLREKLSERDVRLDYLQK